MDSVSLALFNQDWALWVAFFFSLLIFSLVMGNHGPAKVGQYLLVGVSLGYLGVLLIQHVLRPRLLTPLWAAPASQWRLWLVVLLGILLWGAAAERLWFPKRSTPPLLNNPPSALRCALRVAGTIPAALMVGVSLSAVLLGLFQGSFWPQFLYTAQSGFVWSTSLTDSLGSVLVVLLTTASLLHWVAPVTQLTANQPRWVQQLLVAWSGLGKRALWFAAGVIFARLLAAHLTLLIGRLQFLLLTFQRSFLWHGADFLWQRLIGGS